MVSLKCVKRNVETKRVEKKRHEKVVTSISCSEYLEYPMVGAVRVKE